MAYKRKRSYRKRNGAKRFPMKRSTKKYRIHKPLKSDFSAWLRCGPELIASSSSGEYNNAIAFRLSNVTNYTNYAAIWDQFRINRVTVWFTPRMASSVNKPYDDATTANLNQVVPFIFSVIDRDDKQIKNSAQIAAMQGHRKILSTKAFKWNFKPSKLVQLYTDNSADNANKVDMEPSWVDMGASDLPYFGLKYAQQSQSPSQSFVYEVSIRLHCSFRKRFQ